MSTINVQKMEITKKTLTVDFTVDGKPAFTTMRRMDHPYIYDAIKSGDLKKAEQLFVISNS